MTEALTVNRILAAWETGMVRGPLDRAIAMLWALGDIEDASDMPLAGRDRALLQVRRKLFGEALETMTDCPGCGARVEMEFSAKTLADSLVPPETETVEADGISVAVRPLTSRDLAAVAGIADAEVPGFLRDRLADPTAPLTPKAASALDVLIEAREATGEVTFKLSCPDCGAAWSDALDIGAHVWAELAATAQRLLSEVAEIAARFGWAEADILAMTPVRRQAYLEMCRRIA